MFELIHNSFKLRLVIGIFIIIAGLSLIPTVLPSLWTDEVNIAHAETTGLDAKPQAAANPNRVSNGLGAMADRAGQNLQDIGKKPVSGAQAFANSVASGTRSFAQATSSVGKAIGSGASGGLAFLGSGLYGGLSAVMRIPNSAFLATSQLPAYASAVVRPSANAEVPVIDEQLAALYSAHSAESLQKPNEQTSLTQDTGVFWPIHGRITTKFGVPHRPYQVTHTGLDISSGSYSGVTAIKPFRAGRVLDVIRSSRGLGNHVVVDHGQGLTSVYAHMSSIAVQIGQEVTTDTVLGQEGSTGASTGTHLHFEVRINGLPTDPSKYIGGQP